MLLYVIKTQNGAGVISKIFVFSVSNILSSKRMCKRLFGSNHDKKVSWSDSSFRECFA